MTKNYSNIGYVKLGGYVWKVNAGGNLYVDNVFMKKIHGQLNIMHVSYSQINVIFFNLHLLEGELHPDNTTISTFIAKLRKVLKSKPYNLVRFAYVWVREQEKSDVPHYHLALIVDESRIHYPSKLLETLSSLWAKVSNGGHFSYVSDCYHIINRGDLSTLGDVIYRISYLGKLRSKGNRETNTNDYSMSRLKLDA
ncbi:inovirus Gp2 family protein [Vibrio lamellibrachiae]|uniref:YagK/YfjJ domain-containing protein n=1 Tax=Vibrio lamellibrachiae TaxID=2910253 RepID=UPI003D0B21B8